MALREDRSAANEDANVGARAEVAMNTTKRDVRIRRGTKAERAALFKRETLLRELLRDGEHSAWRAGIEFDGLARSGLHHLAFATLREYADARFVQGFRTLQRYRRVALAFTEEIVGAHGVAKLDAGLRYIVLTPEHEQPRDLLRLGIRVPGVGGVQVVPFAKATVSDLERAIKALKSKDGAHDDAHHARAKQINAHVQAAVAAPRGSKHHAPRTRTHVTDDKTFRIDVLAIDLDDLERVAGALGAVSKKLAKKRRKMVA
jgi:hypothetical protein